VKRHMPCVLLLVALCVTVSAQVCDREVLVQTSTIDALLDGVYDGEMTYAELSKYGDFGIGTFEGLDGEMIAFDGAIWQIKADGKAYRVNPATAKTPFAAMTFFDTDITAQVPAGTDFPGLTKLISDLTPSDNYFYAIRMDGVFSYMKTRSVPGQKKPYPPLVEVTRNQPEFEFNKVAGTVVGFRCPPYAKGVNVVGDHLHFLNLARTGGGHILAFEVEEAVISIDLTSRYYLLLPTQVPAFAGTDLTKDREQQLHEAETNK
jgi:acetolactate decarboxylase